MQSLVTIWSDSDRKGGLARWGAFLLIGGFALSLVVCGTVTISNQTVLRAKTDDLGHVLAFGVLAIAIHVGLRWANFAPMWVCYAMAFAIATTVGGGIEILQTFTVNRSPSWSDFVRDIQGTLGGLAAVAALDRKLLGSKFVAIKRTVLVAISLWILVATFRPWIRCCQGYLIRESLLPLLFVAEERCLSHFIVVHSAPWSYHPAPAGWPDPRPSVALKFEYQPDEEYAGMGIREPFGDWSAYSARE